MRLLEKCADFVFPQGVYCICCGKYIDKTRTYSLCDHCIRRMNFRMTDLSREPVMGCFNAAAAAMGYGLYERQIIFGLKYKGHTYIARDIAKIIYDCLMADLARTQKSPWLEDEIIVPVPLHRSKLRERGFNQAEKIAFYLGKRVGIDAAGDALLRIRNTEAQRALSPQERNRNMTGAFVINEKRQKLIEGKRILLIDDIYTTGATASNCGKTLIEAGAAGVDFLALSSAKNRHHEFYTCKEENK